MTKHISTNERLPERVTVQLDPELAERLQSERQRAEQVSGYRPSLAQVGERLLRRALDTNTAAQAV